MKKTTISVIHTRYLNMPAEALPSNEGFSEESALDYVNSNISKTSELLHKAGQSKTDIVCTNEDFNNIGTYLRDYKYPDLFASLVSKTAGMISKRMRETAKQYSMYIAANNYEYENGNVYNTSTLYGRNGEIAGQYKKVHLAVSERWKVTPGDKFPVFETDIGNIGFITCYDMIFPETCRLLALNGADIVIHQTQGWAIGGKACVAVGDSFMRVRAAENSVYLIVAKNIQGDGGDGGRSCVIDNSGNIIAETSITDEKILVTEIEPDFDMNDEYNFNNLFAGTSSTRARQVFGRMPSLYTTFTDENPGIVSMYQDNKFYPTFEDGKLVMENWNKKNDTEKAKYHW